jgi:hypothetical protein
MSFNILPKNVIEGSDSNGNEFRAFEYDYSTFATLQVINFMTYLMFGFLFYAISGPIIFVMLVLQFNGRFNPVALTIPILSGLFIYDCSQGWLPSTLLALFVDNEGLVFLTAVNVASIVCISIMVIFGRLIVYLINDFTDNVNTRYAIFFIFIGVIFFISMTRSYHNYDVNWLGLTKKINEMHK